MLQSSFVFIKRSSVSEKQVAGFAMKRHFSRMMDGKMTYKVLHVRELGLTQPADLFLHSCVLEGMFA